MIFKKKSVALKLNFDLLREFPSELLPYRLSFKIGDTPSRDAVQYLQTCHSKLKELSHLSLSSEQIVALNTLYIDDLIISLFERADWLFQESHPHSPRHLALMALGGYGRSEMHLHSDIDLLFIYSEKSEEYLNTLTDSILYMLWDCGLDVGNASRSLKDCRKILREDTVSFTSMLDARYLAGDREVAQEFLNLIEEEIHSPVIQKKFIQDKLKENEDRRKRYGSSVYILEPNVKESEGGLRDFQTLPWFARILKECRSLESLVTAKVLSAETLREFKEARNFLWQVRNAIHFRVAKKNDQLTFQFQEEIAKELGYRDENGILAVEKFMRAYYQHAANIKRITSLAIASLLEPSDQKLKGVSRRNSDSTEADFILFQNKILVKKADCFQKDPVSLMRIFRMAQTENADLDEQTRFLITQNLFLADENFSKDREVNQILREIFSELKGLGRVLHLMHELRLLDKVIPEFGEVLYQPQHDAYHIYTVDTHSIFAVGDLSKLWEGAYDQEFPLFKEALQMLPRHDLLSLGLFFHDVGKGRGKNHAIVGAEMAVRAAERMGFYEKDREVIEFLVKSHLLMPHLAQRRDLDDANLIIQFAKSMQDLDHLNMLFLLTWADIRAVGPEVWTPWKGTLISELYKRTRQVLESGSFTRERVAQLVEELRNRVTSEMGEKKISPVQSEFLQNMPSKYFLGNSLEDIVRHLKILQEADPEQVLLHLSVLSQDNVNELILYTLGTPGLLAKVTGAFAVNDFNILEAKQYVSKTGYALLTLRFTDSQGHALQEERRFDHLKKDLPDILEGRSQVARMIEERKKPAWMQKKIARTFPTRVEIDNDVSAYYTVIDIYAHDRVGLLYQILSALSGLGLYVDVSKISTKVDQVADVFYVKDIFGQKVTLSEKLKKIQGELIKVIDGEG